MKFALLVTAAPFSTQGADTALRFARAAIASGHSIERVFFFRDGVHNASLLAVAPQDERNIPAEWQSFCENNTIDAVVCVSAAVKRGIVDARESKRHELTASNIAPQTVIAGLGLLTDVIINADRTLTFG
jgi:tRNA 2-thiouridine synthesizing protein D